MYPQVTRLETYHPLVLLHINLITQNNLHCSVIAIHLEGPDWILTKGKFSGSLGLACIKNSSRQLSSVSKLFELLTS